MTEKSAQRFVDDTLKRARDVMRMGLYGASDAVMKMRASGMKLS
jgi:hypothetical protein